MLNKFSDLPVQNSLTLRENENYLKNISSVRKTLLQKSLERTWEESQEMGANTAAIITDKYTNRCNRPPVRNGVGLTDRNPILANVCYIFQEMRHLISPPALKYLTA